MPSAFFVGVAVSLRLNIRRSNASVGEAGLTSPPDKSGGRYYISHKAKPILQTQHINYVLGDPAKSCDRRELIYSGGFLYNNGEGLGPDRRRIFLPGAKILKGDCRHAFSHRAERPELLSSRSLELGGGRLKRVVDQFDYPLIRRGGEIPGVSGSRVGVQYDAELHSHRCPDESIFGSVCLGAHG